jgi:hypothetical protein
LRQCNGRYEAQVNPVNGREARCALTAKSIRYWEEIPRVFHLDAQTDHSPCPFRGPKYQWMRNLTLCKALAGRDGRGGFVVVYADAPGLPFATKVHGDGWQQLRRLVRSDAVGFAAVSYQAFLAECVDRLREAEQPVEQWERLQEWVNHQIARVARPALF